MAISRGDLVPETRSYFELEEEEKKVTLTQFRRRGDQLGTAA